MILTNDTPARNRIAVNTLSSLIVIKDKGPPSVQFKPRSYVEKCLKEDRHSSSDLPTGKHTGASNSKHTSPRMTLL